jgi:hypothetical protein
MLIIGVTSEVSLSVSLTRAVMAAGLFTVLTGVVGKVISVYVFPPEPVDDLNLENENLGTNLDVTITESPKNTDQPGIAPNNVPPVISDEFIPISARQIDPQVNKIINSDPQKVAEIVRKMGFEEDE